SLPPCCFHLDPERANDQAAPMACEWTRLPSSAPIRLRSFQPPMKAMFPRADSARLLPNWLAPISCGPGRFGPGETAPAPVASTRADTPTTTSRRRRSGEGVNRLAVLERAQRLAHQRRHRECRALGSDLAALRHDRDDDVAEPV